MSAPDLSSVEFPTWGRVAPSTVRDLTSPFDVPDVEVAKCPECGGIYKGVGCHFRDRPDHRPSLTEKQRDLVVGLLLGDGSLHRAEGENPYLKVDMVTPKFLAHLDRAFGVLSTGVRLTRTATERARKNRGSGFHTDALAEDYSDVYRWKTRSLPELDVFSSWYDSGKKVWPSDIELSPTVLRTWFVGDGCYNNSGGNDCIRISMSNEADNLDKVDSMFSRAGLPEPSNYNIHEYEDGHVGCTAVFTKEDSHTLWEYMGDPAPGFAYKWGHHETNALKQRLREETWRGPFASVSITDDDLSRIPLEPKVNVEGVDRATFHRQELESWVAP